MVPGTRHFVATAYLVVWMASASWSRVAGCGVTPAKTPAFCTSTAAVAISSARDFATATSRRRASYSSSSSCTLTNDCTINIYGAPGYNRCNGGYDEEHPSESRSRGGLHVTMGTGQQQQQQRDRRRQQQQQQQEQLAAHRGSQEVWLTADKLTRRGVLGKTAARMGFAGLLAGVGLAGGRRLPRPVSAAEEDEALQEYASPDGSFALRYPAGFKGFSKPLKTHKIEVNFKSEEVKGYEVGVAVDPVRIESLEKFGTPEEVGARVLKVEQGKDGTLETKLFGATSEKQGDLSLYTLDYFVESTRGFKHFVAKVAIKDNLLYACTAQAKQKDYPEVEDELKRVVDSFRVPA